MKYIQRIDGVGFTVESGKITRWACCDCGLVHDIAFVSDKKEIGVAVSVNRRSTGQRRRWMKRGSVK